MKRTTMLLAFLLVILTSATANGQTPAEQTPGTVSIELTNMCDSLLDGRDGIWFENLNGYDVSIGLTGMEHGKRAYKLYFNEIGDRSTTYDIAITLLKSGKMVLSIRVPSDAKEFVKNGYTERHVTLKKDGTMHEVDLSGESHSQTMETVIWLKLVTKKFNSIVHGK